MLIGRILRLLVRRPGVTLAGMAALGLWGSVAINAVALQDGAHPAPLLGSADRSGRSVALNRSGESADAALSDAEREARQEAAEERQALVRDVQELLAARGFYAGEIDGLMGPQTANAIRAFQQMAELEETGEASAALLAHIQMSSIKAPPVPQGNPERLARAAEGAQDGEASDNGGRSASTLTEADRAVEAPAEERSAADDTVAAVQRVLADLGYAPGRIDGRVGPDTQDAIRRFQEDRGLTPDGQLSERLIRELESVSDLSLG